MILGLRIDVDTLRGTRQGVPALGALLKKHGILASFFFSVGPDNMGRNLFRLLKPAFFMKMLRSKAASLYGWDILLMGTLGPGPNIGKRCKDMIRAISDGGHETGLHAWDHYTWQAHILKHDESRIRSAMERGYAALAEITGKPPTSSAAPGWIANDAVLRAKESFGFTYNSDCRGNSLFIPKVDGRLLKTPQIPVTLPTYDEIIGSEGVTPETYNSRLLSMIKPGKLNVLTIHAEVEGIVCLDMFEDFIIRAKAADIHMLPLCRLLDPAQKMGEAALLQKTIQGREGCVAVQSPSPGTD